MFAIVVGKQLFFNLALKVYSVFDNLPTENMSNEQNPIDITKVFPIIWNIASRYSETMQGFSAMAKAAVCWGCFRQKNQRAYAFSHLVFQLVVMVVLVFILKLWSAWWRVSKEVAETLHGGLIWAVVHH